MKTLCPGCHAVEFDFDPEAGVIACGPCQSTVERESRKYARGLARFHGKEEARVEGTSWKKQKKNMKKKRKREPK